MFSSGGSWVSGSHFSTSLSHWLSLSPGGIGYLGANDPEGRGPESQRLCPSAVENETFAGQTPRGCTCCFTNMPPSSRRPEVSPQRACSQGRQAPAMLSLCQSERPGMYHSHPWGGPQDVTETAQRWRHADQAPVPPPSLTHSDLGQVPFAFEPQWA